MASEFKVRALYDFVGESEHELSFNVNDIIIITSTSAPGNGWWYAKNSHGRLGVIPENYVQTIVDETPEPSKPPSCYAHPDLSLWNGNGSGSQNNYPASSLHNPNNNVFSSSQRSASNYTNTNVDQFAWQPGTNTNIHPTLHQSVSQGFMCIP
ncbi:unnamed protein product [Didymodactylos carnosus]|uniref:SH3 domain-containing protein n=1 Tax=Didymodactylos carnosus TaxID=1234261 RepID=A0A813PC77_9BILA|nr:unnamed protein product [Didymodactylos carnosus]CAF0748299.1 unnamed protein product [Didymodactylos carnosus]CAF3506917.1 unnamed protein product [Didymodactylos carnosus]CAF3527432.1 unnamed protein product [Didymodactylos carnosus]